MLTVSSNNIPKKTLQEADWEIDFYSRPIIESNGKKRWELLISSTQDISGALPFRWEKICPASEVNSIWLTKALQEAIKDAEKKGWGKPSLLRCWRSSMKTMIKRSAEKFDIEVIASRRTYSLLEWLEEREKNIYPNQTGYMTGPIAPTANPILNQAIPLPEEVRGDSWSLASLPVGTVREASQWTIEFDGLIHIKETINQEIYIPGLRMFSKNRSLALSAWLGGLEPVKLTVEGEQIILEASQSDRWLVTDIEKESAENIKDNFEMTKNIADGLQFISVQSDPSDKNLAGFWLLRDM